MKLPTFQTDDQSLSLMQSKWRAQIDPVLANKSLQSSILPNIALKAGSNVVNHKLGRNLIGWRIVRLRANAQIYDGQDSNQTPDLTLVLISNTAVVVNIEVF